MTKNKEKKCLFFNKAPRVSSDERYRMIIDAAAPLFAKYGFSGTTTKQIAKAAKISEALLYKHFQSKEELYVGIQKSICSGSAETGQNIDLLAPNTQSLIFLVYNIFDYFLMVKPQYKEKYRTTQSLIMHNLLDDGSFVQSMIENTMGGYIRKMKECIRAAKEKGDIVGDHVPANLGCWFTSHLAVMMSIIMMPGDHIINYGADLEERVLQAALFCLRGMGLKDEILRKFSSREAMTELVSKITSEIEPEEENAVQG